MLLSEGQMSDYKGAALMLPAMPKAKQLLADKGYDADWFRAALAKRRIVACIPSKSNRKTAIPYDAVLYKQRHKIENMFGRLKDWRRIHTRYDRCAHTYLSAICIAATVVLRNNWIALAGLLRDNRYHLQVRNDRYRLMIIKFFPGSWLRPADCRAIGARHLRLAHKTTLLVHRQMRLVAKGGLVVLHREARVGIALADHAFLERRRLHRRRDDRGVNQRAAFDDQARASS